ncbi:MAG: DUF2500 domain-containing protein [Oscillospiraceae bacterium]|nr:DUF2500 domain-containing protein [Oscillospiraceae bacterium]
MLILWIFLIIVFGTSGAFILAFSDIENSILISIICLLAAFVFTVIFIIHMMKINRKYNAEVERLANLPELNVSAKVLSKIINQSEFSVAIGGDPNLGTDDTPINEYYVSFEFNGRRENAEIDVSLYNTLIEGDSGTLTYKEDSDEFIFVNFQPQLL